MVKGYDPTKSDPSKILLQYLLRWSTTPNPLPIQAAQKYTKHWLKNSSTTSSIYSNFLTLQPQQRPQITLRKKCNKYGGWSYWKVLLGRQNLVDENYPAFTEKDNKIVVCLNFINNKTQLKENIDRQLMILWSKYQQNQQNRNMRTDKQNKSMRNNQVKMKNTKQESKQSNNSLQFNKNKYIEQQQKDKQLMQSLYQGCRQGYKNYQLDKQLQQRISKKCAKYLFYRRSQRQLPLDAKFRYASKVIQEVV